MRSMSAVALPDGIVSAFLLTFRLPLPDFCRGGGKREAEEPGAPRTARSRSPAQAGSMSASAAALCAGGAGRARRTTSMTSAMARPRRRAAAACACRACALRGWQPSAL